MADILHSESVRVIGQERRPSVLCALGRACLAWARWQRVLTQPRTDETTSAPETGRAGSGEPS